MFGQPFISGLQLAPADERALKKSFKGWSDHFLSPLRKEGLPFLLSGYRTLVESIATQSCHHGSDGKRRTGVDWQECCGISYEYTNDLAVRDAIENVLTVLPDDSEAHFRAEILALDARLYPLYRHRPPRTGEWWHEGLPRGVTP